MAERIGGEQPDGDGLDRQDIESVLEARRELGSDYEPALVDGFIERIERAIEARVDARLVHDRRYETSRGQGQRQQLVLGIVSLGAGIPITAIAGAVGDGLPGIFVAWAGIASVNVAHALSGRNRR
ncbi:hypothetical protein [Nocardioides gansuensis]|uniref:hypothetical protein n=1 Tax=Nocardioides gansuensis TaxID=2138300 RepID=UPI001057D211|nr:hypothetical protein [Nocardioides gansuensis]